MMRKSLTFIFLVTLNLTVAAQKDFYKSYSFTRADTLRGALRPERTCFDVYYYDLNILVDIDRKYLEGYNEIYYLAKEDFTSLQIDLHLNMEIEKIVFEDRQLRYKRQHNAVFIDFPPQQRGTRGQFRVYYRGHPRIARNAPWDGGFVWTKDRKGKPWVGVACEGIGASLWWPNKDHLSDEPDSMSIRVAVPDGLTCVANGNLRGKEALPGGFTRFDWFVSYPINNYNVTVNIADYAHFDDVYLAEDGDSLALDYYILSYNLDKAKSHFRQVHKTLACFERYFGKYPFWNDGFALVETPYLGMEHQGAVAYGNQYMRGYLGGMIPRHMDWDYIIVHETGHEYWGNSISTNDHGEMWIHESFTTYLEALFVECAYNYQEAVNYMVSQRPFIQNAEPILGPLHVNWENWEGSDHYFKGSWVLHTLRHAINNDDLWFDILRSFYTRYAMSNVTTEDIVNYVNQCTQKDFTAFFRQYLEYPTIPTLLFKLKKQGNDLLVRYRWKADVDLFDMPILVGKKSNYFQIHPNTVEWKETLLKDTGVSEFNIATELFYINTVQLK